MAEVFFFSRNSYRLSRRLFKSIGAASSKSLLDWSFNAEAEASLSADELKRERLSCVATQPITSVRPSNLFLWIWGQEKTKVSSLPTQSDIWLSLRATSVSGTTEILPETGPQGACQR